MPFITTSKNIRLNGTTLTAECLTSDNKTYKPSSLDLDTVLGNIDGSFQWGKTAFSKSAKEKSISLDKTILSAELQRSSGNYVKATIDLNTQINNVKGALTVSAPSPAPVEALPPTPVSAKHERSPSNPAVTAAAAAAGSLSVEVLKRSASESSQLTAVESETHHESFSLTQTTTQSWHKTIDTKSMTMTMGLAQSCRSLKLEGSVLIGECLRIDGTYTISRFDLDHIIGIKDGALVFHLKGFFAKCVPKSLRLVGTILHAKCHGIGGVEVDTSIDLSLIIRNDNGILIQIAHDEKLSVMLSEVPWMKFKIVAEPDFSLFASHPVMQETLTQIATTTVEHVTSQFEHYMSIALAETVKKVTVSAFAHVHQSLVVLTQNMATPNPTHLYPSNTNYGHLHSGIKVCNCPPFHCSCPPAKHVPNGNGVPHIHTPALTQ